MTSIPPAQGRVRRNVALIRGGLSALLLGLTGIGMASAQALPPGCGSLQMSWGPFDYRPDRYIPETTYRSHASLLAIVENAHFTPEVETLIRGKSSGALPGGDLSYTLAVFPNHHRALIAVSKLAGREKSPQPRETRFSVECYFQRAITFRSDDHIVRMIYANHLIMIDRVRDAESQIDIVANQNIENAFTQRNISLLYLESKNYDKALAHAHKASELGLNIDAVKERLQKLGKWQDVAAQTLGAAVAPASAPPSLPSDSSKN